MDLIEQIAESLRIENIHRNPTQDEIDAHVFFMRLSRVTVLALEQFVAVYAPGNRLRSFGQSVRVGNHIPPAGGPLIRAVLDDILIAANEGASDDAAFKVHIRYERLHPFTDGNGRSGRMLWYWMMRHYPSLSRLGFLHAFYYQTLATVK